ncbi:MAG TPA: class I SAM-dependent methyltransferase [Microbacterium sp.]|nr:class I SAM-dependent methyltransferase [Microbacterium sp.]
MKDWAGTGVAYSASYAPLCAGAFPAMREALGAAVGRSLLDVGSGDGTLADAWANAGWTVTACEPESTMRDVARRQHPHLEVVDGKLPVLPFDDNSYDVVVANFVLNHVASPRAAAAELRRVSRGPVVATIWSSSPSWLWAEITSRAGLEPHTTAALPADEDFERTPAGFVGMLEEAGLEDVRADEFGWTWNAAPHLLWRAVEGGVAGAGALFATLTTEERARFRTAFDSVTAERLVRGMLPLDHVAVVAASAD